MVYALLAFAIIMEVFAEASMKMSDGLRKWKWVIAVVVLYGGSMLLETVVMNELPLGFAYTTWVGAGVVLSAVLGRIIWKERFNLKKISGIACIGIGLVCLGMTM